MWRNQKTEWWTWWQTENPLKRLTPERIKTTLISVEIVQKHISAFNG